MVLLRGVPNDHIRIPKTCCKRQVTIDTDSSMLSFPDEIIQKYKLEEGENVDESTKKDALKQNIINTADAIGETVDNSFHHWAIRAFNAPEHRTKYLTSDREVVADSALFLGKKRYVMHVIDDEGKASDKLKIMGVELKRSSTSDFLKEVLESVVVAILDGKDSGDVFSIIDHYKKDIENRSIEEIAVPSSCKTLNKATEQYEQTGTLKGLHITAKSALIYNLRRTVSDPKINAGDKVYMLYVQEKEKSIAFPVDDICPQWVRDIPVDYDKMWEKVENAVMNYIVAMKWDYKSQRAMIREDLFGF